MSENYLRRLSALFSNHFGEQPLTIQRIPIQGSNRTYFRLFTENFSAIGVGNQNDLENRAFVGLANHFITAGIAVPKILEVDFENFVYLQEDLGSINLLEKRLSGNDPELKFYRSAIDLLIDFQKKGVKGLDNDILMGSKYFGQRGVQFDLQYFKYYFLKPMNISFDAFALEEEFVRLGTWLDEADKEFFLYRDFQARNILIKNGRAYGIDFQDGRRGPAQYDLVSLLYQAKAQLSTSERETLLEYYLSKVQDRESFLKYYQGFVLIRLLQVLGAYGFRGLFEQKSHFLTSIPIAIRNLENFIDEENIPLDLPMLRSIIRQLVSKDYSIYEAKHFEKGKLNISLESFSFKRGLPKDVSGNGGGFIFDCRFINNPGRFEEYRKLTGLDNSVKIFLSEQPEMLAFLEDVKKMIDPALENYLSRGFQNLSLSFGCTGGQHRSVYSLEYIKKYLENIPGVAVHSRHREKSYWPK